MAKVETKQVFLRITCDEETERAQKIQACTRVRNKVAEISGVKETYFTGRPEADITAFAEWQDSEIHIRLGEIRAIEGVTDVQARTLVTV